ncbi:MAG: DUF1611 domain-containing protein [Planctomycetota bacterium]|nr:MAG: DUF1611 domain-containing protein [Planctomycetota bacterium]
MQPNYFFSSLARISDLNEKPFALEALPRDKWSSGDYVAAEVEQIGGEGLVELTCGRMARIAPNDWIVGALGKRSATLEAVGDWRAVGSDLRFDLLTSAAVLGRCTGKSALVPPLTSLIYRGHVVRDGRPCRMADFVPAKPEQMPRVPIVLIVGTSMSSGKTMTARVVVRLLRTRGLKVGGIKFTGIGRYRDILTMRDAGAQFVCDFVDAGLPSTSCPREDFEPSIDYLLARTAAAGVDVIVAEAGASPLEPYNGDLAVEHVRGQTACTILCASDPYAVVGVMKSFDLKPDLVAGRATSTTAAVDLVEQLCNIKALNVLDRTAWPELERILAEGLDR